MLSGCVAASTPTIHSNSIAKMVRESDEIEMQQKTTLASQPATCRTSRFLTRWQDHEDARVLDIEEDLDGDGIIDRLEASESCSGACIVWIRALLSTVSANVPIEVRFEGSNRDLISSKPIPESLQSAAVSSARAVITEVLADEVCSAPEPSLAVLLQPKKLRWLPGKPALPNNYGLEIDIPASRATTIRSQGLHWMTYLGFNHSRRITDVRNPSSKPEPIVIDEAASWQLARTAHGVLLYDRKMSRHAWIYVYTGGRKLRWQSVVGGALSGSTATIDLASHNGPGDSVHVDVSSLLDS